jgi:hypothetical protein
VNLPGSWLSLALLAPLLNSGPASARDLPGDYFPDTFDHFATEEWFGPYLFNLHEPSVYRLSRNPSETVYRVTVLPPFSDYLTLTLYVQPDGIGRLELNKAAQITTTADGGGYQAGPIKRHAVFIITNGAVRNFEQSLEAIHFWHLPATRPSTILDANTFLYEAARAGRYHVIEIEDPGSNALLGPARIVMRLAGETMPD